jgi:hypothetical protein
MSEELLSQAIEVLRWYATRWYATRSDDREMRKDAGKRARKVLLSMGVAICEGCRSEPSVRERKRIDNDLRYSGCFAQPAIWLCPTCAPDLLKTRSGLCWEVVKVVGSSTG